MRRKGVDATIREFRCPICEKKFVPAPYHSYKMRGGRLVCSYSCTLRAEREREEKKRRRGEKKCLKI